MTNPLKIKITVRSAHPPSDARNHRLLAFVTAQGYLVEQVKNAAKNDRTWLAFSHHGEGEDLKNRLRAQGFLDKDFQIRVEYQRGWGFL